MIENTLIISESEKRRLSYLEDRGIVTIRPVALPEGTYLIGENSHLGWPVGIKVGNILLCVYHQELCHHGGQRYDAGSSDAVIVRSEDNGRTWSDPIDIRSFGVNDEPMSIREMNSLAVMNGKVFLASTYGVYVSRDEGLTWELMPGALTVKQTGAEAMGGAGPRMIVHPQRGLVVAGGVRDLPCLDIFNSKDEGNTWIHERFELSDTIHPMEPTFMYHEGHLIFVSRNHQLPFRFHQALHEPQRPVMMVSDTGWFPMTHQKVTNISSWRWPDTTDVDFNPVTERFEAVVTNRNGGVEEHERDESNEQTVNLWSLSKEEMYAGRADQWRFEGTLLRLPSVMREVHPNDIDAGHPGGAVIDEEEGVQHVFIYCGRYSTPAGVYRITRTLETERLRESNSSADS